MSINKIQYQKVYSMFDFLDNYGTEEQCEVALFKWRWPQGFVCLLCKHTHYCHLKNRNLFQCNKCHYQASLTSNILFSKTKLPLTVWFMAMHLVTQSKTSISALELKRQLGVNYKTAWSIRHKLLQGMK